jgi:hypothetical protein
MTTNEVRESGGAPVQPLAPSTAGRYHTTPREDLIAALLGVLLVGGGATDVWAHTNILDTIESFFTPWHAMFYTGFAALAAWTYWLAFRVRSQYPRWWRDGWPAGYLIGGVAVVLFFVGGFFDMVWHTVFGIEASLEASYSPSHLIVAFSGVLLLTSPLRSWWASGSEGGMRAVAGVISAGIGAAFSTVLLLGHSVFNNNWPARLYQPGLSSEGHRDALIGFGAYLVTTVVIVLPFALIPRRRATPGAAAAIVGFVALFASQGISFRDSILGPVIGAVLGAALADAVVLRLDATRGTRAVLRMPVAGAVVAFLTWGGYLLGTQFHAGIQWPPELPFGLLVLTALLGAALGGAASPPSSHVDYSQATR